jgi:hypothetical protein
MTVFVVAALGGLGALDGMFAGFRASCGRTGLVEHRREDLVAARRGLALAALLLMPVVAVGAADAVRGAHRVAVHRSAMADMLTVYLPYGALVLLALAAYVTLSWRRRFLASALLLGPLTLARPLVALGGAAAAAWETRDVIVSVLAFSAVVAVLAVEGLVGRRWYAA